MYARLVMGYTYVLLHPHIWVYVSAFAAARGGGVSIFTIPVTQFGSVTVCIGRCRAFEHWYRVHGVCEFAGGLLTAFSDVVQRVQSAVSKTCHGTMVSLFRYYIQETSGTSGDDRPGVCKQRPIHSSKPCTAASQHDRLADLQHLHAGGQQAFSKH